MIIQCNKLDSTDSIKNVSVIFGVETQILLYHGNQFPYSIIAFANNKITRQTKTKASVSAAEKIFSSLPLTSVDSSPLPTVLPGWLINRGWVILLGGGGGGEAAVYQYTIVYIKG